MSTTMTMSFEAFQQAARAQGCSEVLERRWGPDTVLQPHTHSFAARALVVEGEMWLTVGEATQHLRPGDRFELASQVLHSERYGPQGAVYWVARTDPD
ncbi:MAG: AraC family ligand binding domain-containing protein [Burkholderiaceae bacterium]